MNSIWQTSRSENTYNDFKVTDEKNSFGVIYAKPPKLRSRDHILASGALYFLKSKCGWSLKGIVMNVCDSGNNSVFLDIEKREGTPFFKTKSDAAVAYGFVPLSNYERRYGMIPLTFIAP
jgi:hypothetical protein